MTTRIKIGCALLVLGLAAGRSPGQDPPVVEALRAHVAAFPAVSSDRPDELQPPEELVRRCKLLLAYLGWANARVVDPAYQADWPRLLESRNRLHTAVRRCVPRLRELATQAAGIEAILLTDALERIENFEPLTPPPEVIVVLGEGDVNLLPGRSGLGPSVTDIPAFKRLNGEFQLQPELQGALTRALAHTKLTAALRKPDDPADGVPFHELGARLLAASDDQFKLVLGQLTLDEWRSVETAVLTATSNDALPEHATVLEQLTAKNRLIDFKAFQPSLPDQLRALRDERMIAPEQLNQAIDASRTP